MGVARTGGRSAFTIVELMIVIAIIIILAGLTVPELNEAYLRTRRAEAATNVDGIDKAIIAYAATYDMFPPDPSSTTYPVATSLSKIQQTWAPTAAEWPLGAAWIPDGKVRCGYHHEDNGSGWEILYGVCDVDGQNTLYATSRARQLTSWAETYNQDYCCATLYASCIPYTECY